MADYVISEHARFEMKRRGVSEEIVRSVLSAPEQRLEIRAGRVVIGICVKAKTKVKQQ